MSHKDVMASLHLKEKQHQEKLAEEKRIAEERAAVAAVIEKLPEKLPPKPHEVVVAYEPFVTPYNQQMLSFEAGEMMTDIPLIGHLLASGCPVRPYQHDVQWQLCPSCNHRFPAQR